MRNNNISVVINTYNEESNIKNCLSSVMWWANEVVVVDMYSTDATVSIASEMGAVVFMHEKIEDFDRARKFAIECAKNQWVFLLDADEMVSVELANYVRDIVCRSCVDVVWVPRLNYIFGAPVFHGGWGPNQDAQMRLFKKNKVNVSGEIHNFIAPCVDASSERLVYSNDRCIVHFNFLDVGHQVDKINRYTSIEALENIRAGRGYSFFYAAAAAFWIFFKHYFLRLGVLDGWRGFALSINMVMYKILIFEKMKEKISVGGRGDAKIKYEYIADEVLRENNRTH